MRSADIVIALVEERRKYWRTLQYLGGYDIRVLDDSHRVELEALQHQYEDSVKSRETSLDEIARAMSELAASCNAPSNGFAGLLGGLAAAPAAAPSNAAKANGSDALVGIAESDLDKCTNCKTCYQDLSEALREDPDRGRRRRQGSRAADSGRARQAHGHARAEGQARVAWPPTATRRSFDECITGLQRRAALPARAQHAGELAIAARRAGEQRAVSVFHKQLALLQRRLLNEPASLRDMFIADGAKAIVWEFQQDELGAPFIKTLWGLLARDDDMSKDPEALRLGRCRSSSSASSCGRSTRICRDRYPMFKGLSEGWPAETFIPPYIRPPEERAVDFGLVNQGYLGYKSIGFTARECELFVWLEVLRDKQCEDRPCEVGILFRA